MRDFNNDLNALLDLTIMAVFIAGLCIDLMRVSI